MLRSKQTASKWDTTGFDLKHGSWSVKCFYETKVAFHRLFCNLLPRLKNERNNPIALLSFALSPVLASKACEVRRIDRRNLTRRTPPHECRKYGPRKRHRYSYVSGGDATTQIYAGNE